MGEMKTLALLALLCAVLAAVVDAQNKPFPQRVQYAGSFIKPTNFNQATLDGHVVSFYNFWRQNYVTSAGNNAQGQQMYRVLKDPGGNTVSEGQGYGMVITAYMAGADPQARQYFDGLFRYVLAHPSGRNPFNMQWNVDPQGNNVNGHNSAWDGDADITYGLLVAHEQWGSNGAINYLQVVQPRLDALKATMGPQSLLPMLGDWVNPNDSGKFNQRSPRPSDFMYGHFLAYSKFHTGNQAYWESVLATCKGVVTSLQNNFAASTGLVPDFAQFDSSNNRYRPASAGFLEGGNDGNYWYNAGRVPWRIGAYALATNDNVARTQLNKIGAFISAQSSIRSGYTLSGGPIGDWFSTFFASPFAISAMTDPARQSWLNSAYSQVYNTRQAYYEDSVNLQSLLVLTGNWWQPGSNSGSTSPPSQPSRSPSTRPASPSPASRSPSPRPASPSPSPTTQTVRWADGTNSWWVGVAFQANAVSINCGRGFVAMNKASWNMNGTPVWIWENQGYQCSVAVTINRDGTLINANRPGN